MTFWDQHGQEVEVSQADQKWLDDSYFMTQQMRLEVAAPRAKIATPAPSARDLSTTFTH